MKRLLTISAVCLLCAISAVAQIVNPVKWTSAVRLTDATHGIVTLTATIDDGWHMYSTEAVTDGPVPTSVDWKELKGVKLDGGLVADHKPQRHHDPNFDLDLSWWTGRVILSQRFTVTGSDYSIKGVVGYMSCNDTQCSSPAKEPFAFSGKGGAAAETTPAVADTAAAPATEAEAAPAEPVGQDQLWAPVKADNGAGDAQGSSSSSSLWYIFVACFGGGLLALFTPCVWPIIPMTVSFFLKKSGSRAKSITNAAVYGISIIVIYLVLGLVVTGIFGANELNSIATNAVCNVVFFLLLVVFAVSFFGAFEITLPSSWGNAADSTAEKTTGILSIFFMAFTLVIVSFSCTGPIIGTLLVEAASMGSSLGPAVGMGGFALALAIPFSLFAMFPSMLKRLPRSGGWLNTVKVVLGFIELALSLKFLSVADLAYGWHILDRETFLALWIAIFGLLALYLLGVFRFNSDGGKREGIGVTRFMLALASLAFTVYLVPGLWGAPLRATSAFVPPLSTQDFNLYGEQRAQYDNFEEGMQAAARARKPVLIDFSGYGCVNCRKMEGAVLDKQQVKQLITDRFVSAKLMVDDKKAMPQPVYVEENGRQVELDTYGDMWSYLQRSKFGANSQPYFVVLDERGGLLSGPAVYDEDVDKFISFLNNGLNKHQANATQR